MDNQESTSNQLRALDSRLAFHLRPFGITSRRLYFGSEDGFMGYLLKDFHDAWERYLPASSIPVESQPGMVSNGKPVPAGMLSLPPVLPPVEFP